MNKYKFLLKLSKTAVELEQMLTKSDVTLSTLENSTFTEPWIFEECREVAPKICKHLGSGSGGYADHIFRYACKELFNEDVDKLDYKCLR